MSQATQQLRSPWPALLGRRWRAEIDPWTLGTLGLAAFALAVRVAAAGQQSAYMDEGTNILTGRLLIEQHAVYAEILNWAYGSYLWPLLAGLADELGGLELVRGLTALCGVVMVLATVLAAARLAPAELSRPRRRAMSLLAGGLMAVAPAAIGVGRFGTYDALAGAGFMLGLSLVIPVHKPSSRMRLLAAAALLFIAFLAKYLVAIYFPLVCLYLVFGALDWRLARRPGDLLGWASLRPAVHNLVWFVVPLTAACAGYLLVFLGPLLTLFTSSLAYGDLKSPDPLREYIWTRPELWVLLLAAVWGWRHARWSQRVVAVAGTAVMVAFQLEARPDFDFWKHSIYIVYFLAPLAALIWLRVPQNTGTWRVLSILGAGLAALVTWSPAIQGANSVVDFYPNLNSSVDAIQTAVDGSALILTDDTALRYYLYPHIGTDRVVGPFFFSYQSQGGLEAYRRAISDRFFDTIVLDGGVTPQGNAIGQQLGQTIRDYYQSVYVQPDGQGFTVEVFKPVRPRGAVGAESTDLSWPLALTFDNGAPDWGAHPDNSDWQAGRQVATTDEQSWQGHPVLRFTPTADSTSLAWRRDGHVTRVRARVLLIGADGSTSPVRVGFMGFDSAWQWHDDGFRWVVAPGTWTTITWDLTSPDDYTEVGLKLPPDISHAYLGSFEIDP